MPSLNRPNAPDRLPSSDFGSLFSRPRALRTSDAVSPNTTPSPLSFPVNYAGAQPRKRRTFRASDFGSSSSSSPLASPAVASAQRRPNLADRRSHHSELSNKSGNHREVSSPLGVIVNEVEEELLPLRHCSSSTLSSGAIKIPEISDVRVTPNTVKDDEPPHKARIGSRWKRDFLGGWLEIRVGRQPDGQSRVASDDVTPTLSHIITMDIPSTQTITRVQTRNDPQWLNAASNQQLLDDSPEELESTISTPKEGLYCRTRRLLGLKRDPIDPNGLITRSRTATGTMLDRVSSTLKEVAIKRLMASSAATSVSDLSIAAPRRHRFRPPSVYSTTSSIREMMMGRPPIPTPDPEAMYTGADSQQHYAIEMSERDNPNFLPSEARRVNTPPLPDDAPGKRKHRGFFFDYGAPTTQDTSRHQSTHTRSSDRTGSVSDMEWYRRKLDAVDLEPVTREEYAASVPDHLPNSPLCPRNPKHKSKGIGTCPYHGKNKASPPQQRTLISPESEISPTENW